MKKQPHEYRDLSPEFQDEVFARFIISSLSYSKLTTFARNEKAFEKQYVFREGFRSSASQIAGQSYHHALEYYFGKKKEGVTVDIVDLQTLAYNYIEEVDADKWKIQKTTKTVQECIDKATKVVTSLLNNFLSCISTYESEIKEILYVEIYLTEFLTVNGVAIPLPFGMKIDLVFVNHSDKIIVADHKSKNKFSDEKELKFSMGVQAIIYALGFEENTGVKIDEVWIVENKYSKNSDKTIPQLAKFVTVLDADTSRLYQSLLYEPLRRVLEAVSNPDHVYLINDSDNFVDKAELYEFWSKTMISEVEDFNIPEEKKEMITKRLKKIRDANINIVDPKIIKKFQSNAAEFIQFDLTNKNMTKQEKIEHVLLTQGVSAQIEHKFDGYSSDTFLLSTTSGTSLNSVKKYKLDIAGALSVSSIRISDDLFIYKDRSFLAIEAKKKRERDLLFDPKYLDGMKIPLGIDNLDNLIVWDLNNHSTPHMLISGATGSGKSVQGRTIIEFCKLANIPKIVIFDLKNEFKHLEGTENVEVIKTVAGIEARAKLLVAEMNEDIEVGNDNKTLIVMDEFADVFMQAKKGKELDVSELVEVGTYKQSKAEILSRLPPQPKMALKTVGKELSLQDNIQSLLQKGRSSGYRLLMLTQRASVDIIKGSLKTNLTVRVCFKMVTAIDSKVILDESGAESLAGGGDALINSPEYFGIQRFQAFFKK